MSDFLQFVDILVREKPLLSLPLVFISGVLVSFTPCFYPLIPVILGMIGIDKDASRKEAFFLSLTFVLGLASVYTVMGALSALTGSIFGQFTKVSLIQFIAAVIFLIMGLALLEVVHIPLRIPSSFKPKRMGFLGAFILGVVSALVVGGCTFPVLGSILTLMALTKNVLMGGLLLFAFSLGIGAVFIVVAVFEARILSFLKSKAVLSIIIKKLFGIILILLSVYFFIRGGSLL